MQLLILLLASISGEALRREVRLAQSAGATKTEFILKYENEAESILNESNATLSTHESGCTEGCREGNGCLRSPFIKHCCSAGRCVPEKKYVKPFACCKCTQGTTEEETYSPNNYKIFTKVASTKCGPPPQRWNHCDWFDGTENCPPL
mmetsp:Transcript_81326/g.128045  ORF Transcript_81326/g.128045 Transcript_81326/m.128045 type:complete len:148 (+) Transcript_81326:77-520(+)